MKKRSFLFIALSLMAALCLSLFAACGGSKEPTENTVSFEISVQGYTGEGVADKTVKTGEDFKLPSAPEIEYYEFDYWTLGTEQYKAGDTYKVEKDGNIKFTAVYAETFVLTYSVAEGTQAPAAESGRVGAEITLKTAPDNGYSEFKNWVIGGTEYEAGAKYAPAHGATTATAAYTDTFVLTYAVEEGLTAPEAATGKVGEKVTLPEGPAKADYKFAGWRIGDKLYAAGEEYAPELGATTATAEYAIEYVYITYSVEEGLTAPETQRVKVGEEVTLAAGPAKEDYAFEGWKIGETLYKPEDKYTVTAESVTATAEYKVAYIYVTFEIAEGSGLTGELGNPVRVAVDTALTESDIPELTAPEFFTYAWYLGEEEVAEFKFSENVTVIAKNVYVGTVAEAFEFIPVDETASAYTVMASANFADYVTNGRVGLPASYNNIPVVGITAGSASENAFGKTAAANLEYVFIPATYTQIGAYAFYQNSTLVTVVYENGTKLEAIGANAFRACQALATISDSEENTGLHFPASLKTIGDSAFQSVSLNTRPVNIYFDADKGVLESIGANAFRSDGTTTAKLSGFVINTAFPATLKTIGEYAFHCNPIIGRVDFGENATLETIGGYAFGQHTLTSNLITYTLTELVIPKSVTSVGMHAFQNNQALQYVEFEAGSPITELFEHTFNMCYALEEIKLPAGLKTIAQHVFSSSFKNANGGAGIALNGADGKFVMPAGVTVYPTNVFNGSTFSSVTIPATVTEIGSSAFAGAVMSSLAFAEGGTEALVIGEKAFNSQYITSTLVIPARVTAIGAYAFWKANLTELSFADGELPLAIENNAFNALGENPSASLSTSKTLYPFTATSITLPARTASIGTGAFNGQLYLQEVNFAEGCKITAIPNYAFAYCSSLRAINIPESVTTIGQYAYTLYSLAGIKSAIYNDGTAVNTTHTVADIYIDIEKITIPANVEKIDTYAFYNRGLKLKTLEFLGTSESKDLTIEANSFGILATFASALDATNKGNVTLTSVKFPANLVSVGGLFLNGAITSVTCQFLALATADLSACTRLTTLGDYFMAGTALTSISIPDSVKTIGNYVFANKMVVNGEVTATMKYNGKVTLPQGLTSLGTYFCAAVEVTGFEIASSNANYKTVDGVIFNKDGTKLINYPYGKTATSYKVPDGCTTIADGAFKSNTKLTSIEFNGVETIEGTYTFARTKITKLDHTFKALGNYTFFSSALETVNLDMPLSAIATSAYLFQNSEALTTVTLGKNITVVSNFMFAGCKGLTTVTLNGKVNNIGNSAFNACESLKKIDAPEVTTLGTNVFQNAKGLESVTLGKIANIGVNSFANTNMTSLTLTNDKVVTLANVNAFTGYSSTKPLTIYVPAELVASYQAAANWVTLVGNGTVSFAAIAG